MKINVLVTGAGSGVGQGIYKSLRASTLDLKIIIADIGPLNSAMFRGDDSVIIPRVESEGALESMIKVLNDNAVDVVMIGSEFDLEFFAKNKSHIEQKTKALIIASPLETVRISNDKWLTYQFLQSNNLPCPKTFLTNDINEAVSAAEKLGYPTVLKTRTGTSSRHVHIVKSEKQLRDLFPSVPNPMVQEMITLPKDSLESEFTCSIFKTLDKKVLGPFTARRTLRGGSSWIVEVDKFDYLYQGLIDIGNKLDFMGSLNVQLMYTNGKVLPFEFNARFSGTTAVRTHFGFNEPEMAIRSYFLKESIAQPEVRKGLALRYLEEVFVEDVTATEILEGKKVAGHVRPWF